MPIAFPNLRYMSIRNARMDTKQVPGLVGQNQHWVCEFDFDNVVLNDGSWDDALAPVMESAKRSTKSDRLPLHPSASISEISAAPLVLPKDVHEAKGAILAPYQEPLETDLDGAGAGGNGVEEIM